MNRNKGRFIEIFCIVFISVLLLSCSEKPSKDANSIKNEQVESIKELAPTNWLSFRGDTHLTGKVRVENYSPKGKLKLLWSLSPQNSKKESNSGIGFSNTPVIEGDNLYIGGSDGFLYSIPIKEGKVNWKINTGSPIEASVLIHKNTLFCGSLNGEMAAFDKSTGKKQWCFKTDGRIVGSANIAITGKKNSLIFGSYDNNVYCLNLSNGTEIWRFKSENYVNGTPSVSGGKAVFGGCDEKLRFLDALKGNEIFSVDSGSYIPGSPVIYKESCFAALYDGEVICVDIKKRAVLWRFAGDPDKDTFLSSPAVEEGRMFVTSRGSLVYCINAITGEQIWEFPGSAPFDASPVIFGNILIAAATDGVIYLLEKETGSMLSKYETGESFIGSPSVSGNRLFIASEEGTVYTFLIY